MDENQYESIPSELSEDSLGPEPLPVDLNESANKLSKFHISKQTRKTLKEPEIKHLFPMQYMTFDHVYDQGTCRTLSFCVSTIAKAYG